MNHLTIDNIISTFHQVRMKKAGTPDDLLNTEIKIVDEVWLKNKNKTKTDDLLNTEIMIVDEDCHFLFCFLLLILLKLRSNCFTFHFNLAIM